MPGFERPTSGALIAHARRISFLRNTSYGRFRQQVSSTAEGTNALENIRQWVTNVEQNELLPYFAQQMKDPKSAERQSAVNAFIKGTWWKRFRWNRVLSQDDNVQAEAAVLSLRRAVLKTWLTTLQSDGKPPINFKSRENVLRDFGPLDDSKTVRLLVDETQAAHRALSRSYAINVDPSLLGI